MEYVALIFVVDTVAETVLYFFVPPEFVRVNFTVRSPSVPFLVIAVLEFK